MNTAPQIHDNHPYAPRFHARAKCLAVREAVNSAQASYNGAVRRGDTRAQHIFWNDLVKARAALMAL